MATFLYRLGRFSFRRRRLVALAWLVLLATTIVGAVALATPTSGAVTIPGTPAQRAIDLLGERFPQASAGGATARIVFAAPAGQTLTTPERKAAIGRAVTRLGTAPQVASVSDPFTTQAINPAGSVGYAEVRYLVTAIELTGPAREALASAVDDARSAGLTVEVGGDAIQAPPHTGGAEALGVVVAAIVLVVTFGSLVAAGLPLLTAILGVSLGLGTISAATYLVDMSATTSTLAAMLGLAVAIDYALFIVSRYRHEIAVGREPEEAVGRAVGTAGSAVVFAGLTVVIALAGMGVAGIPFLTQMGVAAAATVAVSVVIALTLLPAMLGFAGRRITAGRVAGLHERDPEDAGSRPTFGSRWVTGIVRRPVIALLAAVIGLGVVAIPALDLRLGMPNDGTAPPDTSQRKAYDLLAGGFGPGFNAPLTIVIDSAAGSAPAAADQAAERIRGFAAVAAVTPALVNPAGDTAIVTVIPAAGPSDPATEELVRRIRGMDSGGAHVGVTGVTAVHLDMSAKLAGALLPYLALVVGLAFVLLALVFRSLLVPFKATLGFLLSVAATFGAVVAVFQWGWLAWLLGVGQTGPIIGVMPILLIGIVFGLAMDYQVFLVTRMREEYVHGAAPSQAIVSGFSHGARVVTAAALIMISVFAGFVLSADPIIKTMGFGLGIAVLFDALVVRMTIVPAVMTLLGRAAWWLPRWLDKALPDVDVEGEKLRHHLERTQAPGSVARPAESALR